MSMNTHKEPIKIGDTVSYLNQGEYEVVGLSTMMRDDPGEPEWKITHSMKEVAIADIYKGITYQKPCWVSVKDVALLVEPTPPSQIEEEPRLNEPGKIIPYKTFRGKRYVDLDWLLKELEAINKLTKEDS